MVRKTVNLDMTPGVVCPVIHVSQYDRDAGALVFNLFTDQAFTIPSGATVTICGTKPDKTGFTYNATWSGSTVTADLTEQMTAVAGEVVCELRVTSGADVVGTQNFALMVEAAALSDETVISETDIPLLQEAVDAATQAAESASQAESTLASAVKYSDIVNNGTYAGAAGQKALDAKMGKTLTDSIGTKLNATLGAAYNPTLRFGVGSAADATGNPHIELRRAGGSGSYALSLMYYDESGSTQGSSAALVDANGNLFPTLAPKSHASSATTYGAGNASSYGHVKLSDNYTSSAGAAANSVGASSKAVHDAYNELKTALDGKVTGTQLSPSESATFSLGDSNVGLVVAMRNNTATCWVGMVSKWVANPFKIAEGTDAPVTVSVNTSTGVVTVASTASNQIGVLFITA